MVDEDVVVMDGVLTTLELLDAAVLLMLLEELEMETGDEDELVTIDLLDDAAVLGADVLDTAVFDESVEDVLLETTLLDVATVLNELDEIVLLETTADVVLCR